MRLSGCALTLALVLFAAQGARAAAKRKKPSHGHGPAHPTGATTEKRVAPPTRADSAANSGSSTKRAESAAASDESAASAPPDPGTTTTTRAAKTKTYTFGAMDVEGKLKTPQLLYFLNRVKLELEMSAPDHRSFMKELERTADDPSL